MLLARAREVLGAAKEETVSTSKATQTIHATKSVSKKSTQSHATSSAAPSPQAASTEPGAVASQPSSAATTPATPATPGSSGSMSTRVASALALVNQAMALLAITAAPLTPAETKVSTKFRKGGEAQIPQLAQLSETYGVEVPSRPTADMATNVAMAAVLAPLIALVTRLLTTLESAGFQARSEAWATATTLYQMLKKASVRNPALQAELAPLQEFFSYRNPIAKATAPKTTAQLARETKRQQNAAKRLQRLQKAVASAAGATPVPGADTTPPPTNGSTPPAAATTASH
jgi:hypothetical protein